MEINRVSGLRNPVSALNLVSALNPGPKPNGASCKNPEYKNKLRDFKVL
jgi:hypothetical protein